MKAPMLNFSDRRLVEKYGSWVRVQVAFYDFLYTIGSQAHARCFNQAAMEEVLAAGRWREGDNLYEQATTQIERTFLTPAAAWTAFLASEEEA